MEWLENIWNWIVGNKDAIFTVVSSAEFASIIALVVSLIRGKKNTAENTAISKELSKAVTEQKETNKTLKTEMEEMKKENAELKAEIKRSAENTEATLTKVTAVVNALSVVYNNSIKNPETRETVDNILTNAKFAETKTRADLIKAMDELSAKAEKQAEEAKKLAEKTKETITNTGAKSTTVLRG
jgi:cell division protein FtsB